MHKLVGGRVDKRELCTNEKEYISVEELFGEVVRTVGTDRGSQSIQRHGV